MSLIDKFTDHRKYTEALAAVCNLDWQEQADQRLVNDDYLREGCSVVNDIITTTKPRIIAVLTVRVWAHLLKFYEGKLEPIQCASMKRKPFRLKLLADFDTLLIKVRHPSRPIPRQESAAYRQIVQGFLQVK